MNPAGSNGAIFSEIMQVLERVWLIHIELSASRRRSPDPRAQKI
jgi:hypothetical protein